MSELSAMQALRDRLEAIGMSQAELARSSGLAVGTINRMFTSATLPSRSASREAISTAVGWQPGELQRLATGETSEPVEASAASSMVAAEHLREVAESLARLNESQLEILEALRDVARLLAEQAPSRRH